MEIKQKMEKEDFLNFIPDKIVVIDIINFLNNNKNNHFFSDIYDGKTIINPNPFLEYHSNSNIIYLYEGNFGQGNYIGIMYLIQEDKYVYFTSDDLYDINSQYKIYESQDWNDIHKYVREHVSNTLQAINTNESI